MILALNSIIYLSIYLILFLSIYLSIYLNWFISIYLSMENQLISILKKALIFA